MQRVLERGGAKREVYIHALDECPKLLLCGIRPLTHGQSTSRQPLIHAVDECSHCCLKLGGKLPHLCFSLAALQTHRLLKTAHSQLEGLAGSALRTKFPIQTSNELPQTRIPRTCCDTFVALIS